MPQIKLRVINQAIFDLLNSCIVIYLDYILVFSCMKGDHVYDLNAVFGRLLKSWLYIRESYYGLYLKKVEFIGYVVSEGSVSI